MKIVAPPSDENENSLVLLKGQTIPKEMVKTASESTHKPRYNISFKLSPTRRQTKHIFAPYSRRAYIDLHQTVQGDRGRRDNSKRWRSLFDPTDTFSYRAKMLIFGHGNLPLLNLLRRAPTGLGVLGKFNTDRLLWQTHYTQATSVICK